jgi:chromosome segregation ATPase
MDRHANTVVAGLEKALAQSQADAMALSKAGEQKEAEIKEMVERNQALSDERHKLKALIEERDREIEKLNAEICRNRAEMKNIRSDRDQAVEAKAKAQQDAAVAGAKLDAANERLEDWKVIVQDLKTQLSATNLQEGKAADTELTAYFQQDIEAEDLSE